MLFLTDQKATYMCSINIDIETFHVDTTYTNSLAPKPVSVEDLVNVAIERPLVKHEGLKWVSGQNTEARSCHSTAQKYSSVHCGYYTMTVYL